MYMLGVYMLTSLFRNSLGFWNRLVPPSSFGNAGFAFEGGTTVFEVQGFPVLSTEPYYTLRQRTDRFRFSLRGDVLILLVSDLC